MDLALQSRFRFSGSGPSVFGDGLMWAACGAMSVALHVGMLATMSGVHIGPTAGGGASSAMMVRILPAAESVITEPRWEPPALLPDPISRLAAPAKMLPIPSTEVLPSAFDEAAYMPARQLTVRPSAAEYITVPYPKDAKGQGTWKALLFIFIDEDGTVAKVRIHDTRLPEPFAHAAITTFGRARFHPGRMGDTPVKTRMLIEVEFENSQPDGHGLPRIASIPDKR